MQMSRRRFIELFGASAAGLAVSRLGFDLSPLSTREHCAPKGLPWRS